MHPIETRSTIESVLSVLSVGVAVVAFAVPSLTLAKDGADDPGSDAKPVRVEREEGRTAYKVRLRRGAECYDVRVSATFRVLSVKTSSTGGDDTQAHKADDHGAHAGHGADD